MIEERVFEHSPPMGKYQDTLVNASGEVIWKTPWQHNVIVEGLGKLVAALLKGDTQGSHIAYWAVGIGEDSWERETPKDSERREWTALKTETGRKAIPEDQIIFLDGDFTNQLQITAEFTTADIPGGADQWKLREFGLFAGGDATPNSGTLINHRTHPRIDLQDGFTLKRTLNLTL
jgi:hypothetical protein